MKLQTRGRPHHSTKKDEGEGDEREEGDEWEEEGEETFVFA